MLDKTGLSGEVCENEAGSEGPRSDVAVSVCAPHLALVD